MEATTDKKSRLGAALSLLVWGLPIGHVVVLATLAVLAACQSPAEPGSNPEEAAASADSEGPGDADPLMTLTLEAGGLPAFGLAAQVVTLDADLEMAAIVRGATARLAVEMAIANGFHINANPPSEEWLIATAVTVGGVAGVAAEQTFYPKAEKVLFGFWPQPLAVYERSAVAGVRLSVEPDAPLGEHTLDISVDYQACNDQACLAPTRVSMVLPMLIAPTGSSPARVGSALLARAPFGDSR